MTEHEIGFGGPWPARAAELTKETADFRPLQGGAMRIAQDRLERVASTVSITVPPDEVWQAMTNPARVAEWLGVCRGDWARADEEVLLDFEDGEFFWCRTMESSPPSLSDIGMLRYLWRWVGIGPATSVTWTVVPGPNGTTVTVVEEAVNPPSDWRSWNGMGWPGILDQLAGHLRTGTNWRWPWRRMGPYLQIPLPQPAFPAWEALTDSGAVKHWLQRTHGSLGVDDEMTLMIGDASGAVRLRVTKLVDAAQEFPSYLPYLEFALRRPNWQQELGGRIWIEPVGLGESLLQVFHHGWESLTIADPIAERKLLTDFWIAAAARAQSLFQPAGPPAGPHGWSVGGSPDN
ncbi:SRPBCC domain-containing protein [Nocardia sp. NBC_01499]|uniref:SRPBCC family protein n=1 Tax=Nocardia sp. NBC_01499 TaxID=2903597 RepID=UPI00386F3AF0